MFRVDPSIALTWNRLVVGFEDEPVKPVCTEEPASYTEVRPLMTVGAANFGVSRSKLNAKRLGVRYSSGWTIVNAPRMSPAAKPRA